MKKVSIKIFVLFLTLSVIELIFRLFSINSLYPSPFAIIKDLTNNFNYIVGTEAIDTLKTIFEGLIPAIIIGYLLSFICFHFKVLNEFIRPIIDFTQLIPKTALILIFVAIPF